MAEQSIYFQFEVGSKLIALKMSQMTFPTDLNTKNDMLVFRGTMRFTHFVGHFPMIWLKLKESIILFF